MKTLTFLLLFFCGTVQAEGLYLTLGVGHNESTFTTSDENGWNNGGGTGAFLLLSYQWDSQAWCFDCMPSVNWAHLSQWDVGPPVDDGVEDSVDHYGLAATWKLF